MSSDRDRWRKVEELFHRALELKGSREERAAVVRSWSGADTALADEVISLANSADAVEAMRSSGSRPAETDARLGREVGGYRLCRELGRGGMGVVYAAQRAAGAEGLVALKVVATRLRSRLLIERFEQERHALAAVRHPGIAHLLDGGVSETGEPYFVMELIEGLRLDSYCQSRNLEARAILELFQQLCAAVSFAHNHRVLHGDLKPSNVMVTAAGELKLLDFGAAMLLTAEGAAGGDGSLAAAFTPAYASPERIAGQSCVAASDVYSLGAMLYRLLTGYTPVHPSTVLHTEASRDSATTVFAKDRNSGEHSGTADGGDAELPAGQLDADLRAIVARAMAGKQEDRYASVAELAADLRRYLEYRPVEARPASLAGQAAKFIRRNRTPLAVVVALALALAAGTALALRQTRAAHAEAARAREQMAVVRQLAGFLSSDLYDRLTEVPGSMETQRRVTAQALEYLDGMRKDATGDFDFELDLANAYTSVGKVMGDAYQPNLGDAPGAARVAVQGVAVARDALRLHPNDARALRTAMLAEQTAGEIYFGAGNARTALPYSRRATELGDQLAASKAATAEDFFNVAGIYSVVGDEYDLQGSASLGDQPAATAAYRKFIALAQESLRRDGSSVRAMRSIGTGYVKIGNLLVEQNPTEARPLFRSALAEFDSIPHSSPAVMRQKAVIHQKLADCYYYEGNYRASLAELKMAEAINLPMATADQENMRLQMSVVSTLRDEAEDYERMKDWRAARDADERVAANLSTFLRRNPQNRAWQAHLSETFIGLAKVEWKMGAREQSASSERQAIALAVQLAQSEDASAEELDTAAYVLLVAKPETLRQPKLALVFARRSNQMVRESDPDYLLTLAKAERANGDPRAARQHLEKVLTIQPSKEVHQEAETLLAELDATKP